MSKFLKLRYKKDNNKIRILAFMLKIISSNKTFSQKDNMHYDFNPPKHWSKK